jgi:ABC-type transporter Mla subunit MlaD
VHLRRDGVEYRFLAALGLRTDIILWKGTRAVVVAKPLGGTFVDLQLPPPARRQAVLEPGSTLEGATSASLATLLDHANAILSNLDGTVTEMRTTFKTKGAGAVLDHPQISKVLANLNDTLTAFRALAAEGQVLVQHGDATMKVADRGLVSLDKGLATVQTLLDKHSADLDGIVKNLAATLQEAAALTQEARTLLKQAGPEGVETLKALDRNLRSTEELLELLKARPNRLVFGKPSPEEQDAAKKRVQEAREAQKAGKQ